MKSYVVRFSFVTEIHAMDFEEALRQAKSIEGKLSRLEIVVPGSSKVSYVHAPEVKEISEGMLWQ